MKNLIVFLLLSVITELGISQTCSHRHMHFEHRAEMERSDTINILNTTVVLDITDVEGDDVVGNSIVLFESNISDVSTISLDLLKLNVDSVIFEEQLVAYSYNDTLLIVDLDSILQEGNQYSVNVYYHGQPHQDPSGWGGWYSSGGYAYNLGVGFADDPHSYGRVFHPCFDNFVERSSYDFFIKTANGKTSYCSGNRISVDSLGGDTIVTHWKLDQHIPAYLASVSVGYYTHYEDMYVSIDGDSIPIWIAAVESDTANVASSFQNLQGCLLAFENAYGPYEWDRVGYHLVPFNGGAMEHATNISYPISAVSGGGLGYETLMAHELAHHWFGNLVTCQTANEMWINEGMASFSEAIFLEGVYGEEAYKSHVKSNHYDVVRNAHLSDGSFLTISNVPHESTYGDHSYNKGADLAHTLRGYTGDSLFFEGLTYINQNNMFSDLSSEDFRDNMNMIDGIDVTDFFNDWIFNPGFPQFSVDSFIVSGNGPYETEVFVSQKLRAAPELYSNVPMDISVMDQEFNIEHYPVILDGVSSSHLITTNVNPQLVTMDLNERISQAITSDTVTFFNTGTFDLDNVMLDVTVDQTGGSDFLRVEHMWVGPDTDDFDNDYVVNKTRYWRFDGFISDDWVASTKFYFDGRPNAGSHFDDSLYQYLGNGVTENDMKLLFREGPGYEWRPFNNFTVQPMGNASNGAGYILAESLIIGEYTFGYAMSDVGIDEESELRFKVFPNPSHGSFFIEYDHQIERIEIFDLHGRSIPFVRNGKEIRLSENINGVYIVKVFSKDKIGVSSILINN